MLIWALLCVGLGLQKFENSVSCFAQPPNSKLRDHVNCQRKGDVCLLLVLGWVKCLLKCQSLSVDFRDIQGDQVTCDSMFILLSWHYKYKCFLCFHYSGPDNFLLLLYWNFSPGHASVSEAVHVGELTYKNLKK